VATNPEGGPPPGTLLVMVYGSSPEELRYTMFADNAFGVTKAIDGLQTEAVARGMCVTISMALVDVTPEGAEPSGAVDESPV